MATWVKITQLDNVPKMGARKIVIGDIQIALFKTKDGSIFAIENECPHKKGTLADGLVHDHIVTCPLHNTDIVLSSGEAVGEDYSCAKTYKSKVEDDYIYLEL